MSTVVVMARQAGSAAALAPVVRALETTAGITCLVFGLEHAARTWAAAGIPAQTVGSFAEALPYLATIPSARPSVALVTGTSFNAVGDQHFWTWDSAQGIPSLAFVDNWTNYCQRFSSVGMSVGTATGTDRSDCRCDCLPTRIAVIDTLMAMRLIEAGCPQERVVITGHPGWDPIIQRRGECAPTLQRTLAGERILVLFVSEPLAQYYGNALGYTEVEALRLLCDVLTTRGDQHNEWYTVAVKPHPVQEGTTLAPLVGDARRVHVCLVAGDRLDLVAASRIVVGMNSLLLYEAALMGKPVVALQPGRRGPSDLVDYHPGILLATDSAQAIAAIAQALTGDHPVMPAPKPAIPQWLQMIARNTG